MTAEHRPVSGALADFDLTDSIVPYGFSQGPRPLCLAFAVGSAHQMVRGVSDAYSPEALWHTCFTRGSTDEWGTTFDAVAAAIDEVGQVPLATWPYNPTLGERTEAIPSSAAASAWDCAELDLVDIELSLSDIYIALASGRPVVVAIEMSDEFTFVKGDSIVEVPDEIEEFQGFHAVLIVGARQTDRRQHVYRILNSWGDDWADNGYTWLPAEYVRRYAAGAMVLTI